MKKLKITLKMPPCISYATLSVSGMSHLSSYEDTRGPWASIPLNRKTPQESIILSFLKVARTRIKLFLATIFHTLQVTPTRKSDEWHTSHVLFILYAVYSYAVVKLSLSLSTDALLCAQYSRYILSWIITHLCGLMCLFKVFRTSSPPQAFSFYFWPITQELKETSRDQSSALTVRAPKLGLEENNDAILFSGRRVWFPAGYASTLRLTVLNWELICWHVRRS